jgi:hypothetical protein
VGINKIKTYYSKPSSDIQVESEKIRQNSLENYKEQKHISKIIDSFKLRKKCVCCGTKRTGTKFTHREVSFYECEICSHIQTVNTIPIDFPEKYSTKFGYSKIYPKLSTYEYSERVTRIYEPKFDWIINSLSESQNYTKKEILEKKWLEIGSGAGYFLNAACKGGVRNIKGFERNDDLCNMSNETNLESETILWKENFSDILDKTNAEIYCTFFVLEHVDDLSLIWRKIKEKPLGTIFVFSVPVFGVSSLLEEYFEKQYARNLDGVVHTHIFTDLSINYGLHVAECKLLSEWIFGQDFSDFLRFTTNNISGVSKTKIHTELIKRISDLHDEFQTVLDLNRLSDQRHILAIRA